MAGRLKLALALLVLTLPAGLAGPLGDSPAGAPDAEAFTEGLRTFAPAERPRVHYELRVGDVAQAVADGGTFTVWTPVGGLALHVAEEERFVPGQRRVVTHQPDGGVEVRPYTGRFLHGVVLGDPESAVRIVLNTGGLYGLIRTSTSVLSLQPAYEAASEAGAVVQEVALVSAQRGATASSIVDCDLSVCRFLPGDELCKPLSECVPPLEGPCDVDQDCVPPIESPCQPLGECVPPIHNPCQPASECVPPIESPCQPLSECVPPIHNPCQPLSECVPPIDNPCEPAASCVPSCGDLDLPSDGADPCDPCGGGADDCVPPIPPIPPVPPVPPVPTCEDFDVPSSGVDPCDPCGGGADDCVPPVPPVPPIPSCEDLTVPSDGLDPCEPCGLDCVPTCSELLRGSPVGNPCNPCPGGVQECVAPCEDVPAACCPGGIAACIPSCSELLDRGYGPDPCNPCPGGGCAPCGGADCAGVVAGLLDTLPAPNAASGPPPPRPEPDPDVVGPPPPPPETQYWFAIKPWADRTFASDHSDWPDRITSAYYGGDDMWRSETRITIVFYALEASQYLFAEGVCGNDGGSDAGMHVFAGWVSKFYGPNAYSLFEAGVDPGDGVAGCGTKRALNTEWYVDSRAVHAVVAHDFYPLCCTDTYDPDDTHDRALAANHEATHNAGGEHIEAERGWCDQNLMSSASDRTFWCMSLWRAERTIQEVKDFAHPRLTPRG